MEEVEPALLSRHGAEDASLAHVVSAVKSIRGEGLKVGLVDGGHALKSDLIPLDKSLFDVVSWFFERWNFLTALLMCVVRQWS